MIKAAVGRDLAPCGISKGARLGESQAQVFLLERGSACVGPQGCTGRVKVRQAEPDGEGGIGNGDAPMLVFTGRKNSARPVTGVSKHNSFC